MIRSSRRLLALIMLLALCVSTVEPVAAAACSIGPTPNSSGLEQEDFASRSHSPRQVMDHEEVGYGHSDHGSHGAPAANDESSDHRSHHSSPDSCPMNHPGPTSGCTMASSLVSALPVVPSASAVARSQRVPASTIPFFNELDAPLRPPKA